MYGGKVVKYSRNPSILPIPASTFGVLFSMALVGNGLQMVKGKDQQWKWTIVDQKMQLWKKKYTDSDCMNDITKASIPISPSSNAQPQMSTFHSSPKQYTSTNFTHNASFRQFRDYLLDKDHSGLTLDAHISSSIFSMTSILLDFRVIKNQSKY